METTEQGFGEQAKPTLYYCEYCADAFKTPCDGPLCNATPITNYGPPVDDKCGTCGEWPPCVCSGATHVEY